MEEKYYSVTFRNYPNATQYVYGEGILDAIDNARAEMFDNGASTPYLAPIARPAVYKEWSNDARRYTNGGHFLKGDLA